MTFYMNIFLLSISIISGNTEPLKWVYRETDLRPSQALQTAGEIWTITTTAEEGFMLKHNISMTKYEETLELEVQVNEILKKLLKMEDRVSKINKGTESGHLKSTKGSEEYDKLREEYHSFLDNNEQLLRQLVKIKGHIGLILADGFLLEKEFLKTLKALENISPVYETLREVGIELQTQLQKSPNDFTSKRASRFDYKVLMKLKDYFSKIDKLEDKINKVLMGEESLIGDDGKKITDEEAIVYTGTARRYDIFNNEIMPLVKQNSEMLSRYDAENKYSFENMKKLNSELMKLCKELKQRLDKLTDEIEETDLRIFALAMKYNNFKQAQTLKDVQDHFRKFSLSKNKTGFSEIRHEEL